MMSRFGADVSFSVMGSTMKGLVGGIHVVPVLLLYIIDQLILIHIFMTVQIQYLAEDIHKTFSFCLFSVP